MNTVLKIRELIAENNLTEAFSEIKKLPLNSRIQTDLTNLESRFNRWEGNLHRGQENMEEINKITHSLLYYLGKIDGQSESKSVYKKRNISTYYSWGVLLLSSVLIFSIVQCNQYKVEVSELTEDCSFAFNAALKGGISQWGFVIDTKTNQNYYEFNLQPKYFKKHYKENKGLVFVIYKSNPSIDLRDKTEITISKIRDIPDPNEQTKNLKVDCPKYPIVNMEDKVYLQVILVSKDLNLSNCNTIEDIENLGGELIFHKWSTPKLLE